MGTITAARFGVTKNGETVIRYDLKNEGGMTVSILNYGCTVQRILIPLESGEIVDAALGYDRVSDYENGNCYFGAFVGRYANRIRGSRFVLNGQTIALEPNEGKNHLHGVFSQCLFSASEDGDTLTLRRVSPAGEEGYPGTLTVTVQYRLTNDNALFIEYEAETDADTVLNLTNHTYFNLNGSGDVLNHSLRLCADCFAECDSEQLPTGRLISAAGTPMDFRTAHRIGERIEAPYPQLRLCGGYDHHYVLDHAPEELNFFAEAVGDRTGIRLECFTTQPGVQLYTGNYLQNDTAEFGKNGVRYGKHAGFCLETQHAPDSPNQPGFPSTVLRTGERYYQKTVYRFSVAK